VSGIVDFHIHTSPSLVPRHNDDHEVGPLLAEAGITTYVLKAHEGTTAERAQLAGEGAVGSIVLNSPVGGANPDAALVAARLGARVVWMPTISSECHKRSEDSAELDAHRGVRFRAVPVTREERVLDEWHDVFDLVASEDLILASGHVSMDETIAVFRTARARGVQRLLVNHPLLSFLGWRDDHVADLVELGAYLEVGVLADLLGGSDGDSATTRLAAVYPRSLLVFGSDLGHIHYPDVQPGISSWLEATEGSIGASALEMITTTNGKELLSP
jgi:hypothetical protein